MAGLGIGLLFAGYSLGLWGFSLFKGWDVTFGQLIKPPGGNAVSPSASGGTKKKG